MTIFRKLSSENNMNKIKNLSWGPLVELTHGMTLIDLICNINSIN